MTKVMVSTSGSQLLPEKAVETLIKDLLPLTTILTPNLPEAKLLLNITNTTFKDPENFDDMIEITKKIQGLGPKYVVLKGGHLPFSKGGVVSKGDDRREIVVNVLYGDGTSTLMQSDYIDSKNTHGTGCSLACELYHHYGLLVAHLTQLPLRAILPPV